MTKEFEVITNLGDHCAEVGAIVTEITGVSEDVPEFVVEWAERIIKAHPDKDFVHVLYDGNTPQLIKREHLKEVK